MTLNLFYPATFLPHKNHSFLRNKEIIEFLEKSDIKITLTIREKDLKVKSNSIVFVGRLPHQTCLALMKNASALLFLSSYESLGIPILEASINKKSIIVPNLDYSKELIGNSAYFLESPLSVKNLIQTLNSFKNDYTKGINKVSQLKSNTVSSKELIKIFTNELKI